MAFASGYSGSCTSNSIVLQVKGWQSNHTNSVQDCTHSGSGGKFVGAPGISKFTASITAVHDSAVDIHGTADINPGATITSLSLRKGTDNTNPITSSHCIVSSVDYQNEVGGLCTYSFTVEGTPDAL